MDKKKRLTYKGENPATERLPPPVDALENTSPAPSDAFTKIKQNKITNTLSKIKPTHDNISIDRITRQASIKRDCVTVTARTCEVLKGLKLSTQKLLDAIYEALAQDDSSPCITFTLTDYMKKCGLTDRKAARKQVAQDLLTLQGLIIQYKEEGIKSNRAKVIMNEGAINLCDAHNISRNGLITFRFGTTFFEKVLPGMPIMPYPKQIYRLDSKKYQHSYFLMRKITELKNLNIGRPNENIVSVRVLLKAGNFPTKEEVRATDRAFTRRIIEPFEANMDACEETFSWEYCHSRGIPLSDEELSIKDIDFIENLYVHIHWKEYPIKLPAASKKRLPKKPAK